MWLSCKWWQIEQTLLFTTHRKSLIGFQLICLHFTLANSNGQTQGHANFDCEYLVHGDRPDKYSYCQYIGSCQFAFDWCQCQTNFDREYLVNGERHDKYCYSQDLWIPLLAFDWYIYSWPWPILKVKIRVMHISTPNILNGNSLGKHYKCNEIQSPILAFNWYIYSWPWPILKVKANRNLSVKNLKTESH